MARPKRFELGPTVVGAVHGEANFWLHEAPREYTHGARDVASVLPKRLENAGDRGLANSLVDDDPESAARIMLYDQDDAALEARVSHSG